MIYTYKCHECGTLREVLRSMLEEETFPECPNCQVTMGRKYEAAPVHLKGGGFYKNGG